MGQEIEKLALIRGHSIKGIYQNKEDWNTTPIPECDVVMEFTTPETAPVIINYCFDKKVPVISGTTGWNDQLTEIKKRAIKEGLTFLYASNFSIGVNILFEINKKLASLFCGMNDYSVEIHEIHHIHKKDAPSGTAITLAEGINSTCNRYESWVLNKREDKKIPIISERTGEVPGTHVVGWDSGFDSIQLKHTAHSRKGFAFGAVLAAEWLQGKSGVFGMHDLLTETLE